MNFKRVLIVDDTQMTRTHIRDMLESLDLELADAPDGANALLLANDFRPDLVITDVIMPVMDGITFTEFWMSNPDTQDVPVIIMTEFNPDTLIRAHEAGATAFVSKPLSERDVIAVVRAVLELQRHDA